MGEENVKSDRSTMKQMMKKEQLKNNFVTLLAVVTILAVLLMVFEAIEIKVTGNKVDDARSHIHMLSKNETQEPEVAMSQLNFNLGE
jgi:hypothetical protein